LLLICDKVIYEPAQPGYAFKADNQTALRQATAFIAALPLHRILVTASGTAMRNPESPG